MESVQRYKLQVDSGSKTGLGRKQWEFFDLMNQHLQHDPTVSPVAAVSSVPG